MVCDWMIVYMGDHIFTEADFSIFMAGAARRVLTSLPTYLAAIYSRVAVLVL